MIAYNMKTIFMLAILIGLGYAGSRYLPVEARNRIFEQTGIREFFSATLPGYLRKKLAIPEEPGRKREQLLRELSDHLNEIELEVMAAAETTTATSSAGALQRQEEVRRRLEKTRILVDDSSAAIAALESAGNGGGVFQKTASRILDTILPLAQPAPLSKGAICPPEKK